MFSNTERKVHFKCEGERCETGRRIVIVGIPVSTGGTGTHLGHIKRFLSSSGSCCLSTIKMEGTYFYVAGFFSLVVISI